MRLIARHPGSLADRGLEEAKPACVERGRRLEIYLVGRNLQHLVLQADRVAGRHHFEVVPAPQLEITRAAVRGGQVAGARAR